MLLIFKKKGLRKVSLIHLSKTVNALSGLSKFFPILIDMWYRLLCVYMKRCHLRNNGTSLNEN